jgi:hypothetical protein
MKEGALGDSGLGANLIHTGSGKSMLKNEILRGGNQLLAGFRRIAGGAGGFFHTNWFVCNSGCRNRQWKIFKKFRKGGVNANPSTPDRP